MIPAVVGLGVLGLIVGSFLNVVVYRVPAGRSIVTPPSACPHCGAPIRPYDNIPVLSWLILRGRCRDCQAPISPRYPLVELGTGVFFALVAAVFLPTVEAVLSTGSGGSVAAGVLQLAAYLYLAAISVALALIDLDTRRLPNPIVLPAYPVAVVLLGLAAVLGGRWESLLTAAVCAAVYFGALLLIALLWPGGGGMGFGDVKLAGVLGLFLGWLGWPQFAVGVLGGFILGGVFGLILLLAGRGRKARIAYGPWMLGGAWLGIVLGEPIATGYLGLFGLA